MVPASPNFFAFAIFYESSTEGTNFRIMFSLYVLRLYTVHVLYCVQLV